MNNPQFDIYQIQDIANIVRLLENTFRTSNHITYVKALMDLRAGGDGYGVNVIKAADAILRDRASREDKREQERKDIFKWICDGDETLAEQLEERYQQAHSGNLVS